jgi:hypothetical protein
MFLNPRPSAAEMIPPNVRLRAGATLRHNSPHGEYTVEQIQADRDSVLSDDPHLTIANAISNLKKSLGAS